MSGLARWLGWACKQAGDDLGVEVGGDEGRRTFRGEGATLIDLAPSL